MTLGALNVDATGFFLQHCPACSRDFKLRPGDPPKLASHCPYCEHTGDDWWTSEQKNYLEAIATSAFATMFNDRLRGLKGWHAENIPSTPAAPAEMDDDLPKVVMFSCCGVAIRHDAGSVTMHCILCGTSGVPALPTSLAESAP
jgi:hypothetical protein